MAATNTLRKPHFTLLFVVALLLGALATFVVFTWYARAGIAGRRDANRAHLAALSEALNAYALSPGAAGSFPDDPRALYPAYVKDPQVFVNPSWPDRAGYLYVRGVNAGDPPGTLLIVENVPPQKEKLGRFVLSRDGTIRSLTQTQYEEELRAQQARWKENKRAWRMVEIAPGAPQ